MVRLNDNTEIETSFDLALLQHDLEHACAKIAQRDARDNSVRWRANLDEAALHPVTPSDNLHKKALLA